MKIHQIQLILFTLLISMSSFSQNDWHYLSGVDAEPNRYDDVYFIDSMHGWACGPESVIRTTDAGITWDTIARNMGYGRAIEFINDSVGFLGVVSGNKFYKTTDRGNTWIDITSSLASPTGDSGVCGMAHYKDTIIALGTWYFEAYIHISYDQGNTWSFIQFDTLASNLVDAYMFNSKHIIISGRSDDPMRDTTILETTDGGSTWNTVFRSYKPIQFAWKLQHVNNHLMVGSIENRSGLNDTSFIVKSYDNGHTWEMKMVVPFDIDMEGIGFLNDSIGFCGGWSPGMYKTTDGGNTWNYYNIGANLNRFFVLNENLAYASGQIIYKYYPKIYTNITESKPSFHDKPNYIKTIFPNPIKSGNILNIEYNINKATNVNLDLYSPEGKLIKSIVHDYVSEGMKNTSIELPFLSDGNYLIVLGTDANSHSIKLIIKN